MILEKKPQHCQWDSLLYSFHILIDDPVFWNVSFGLHCDIAVRSTAQEPQSSKREDYLSYPFLLL